MAEGFTELKSLESPEALVEMNRMFRELYDTSAGDNETVRIYSGFGTPENNVKAGIGSIYLRKDGGAGTTIYKKESGTGATGWVAIADTDTVYSIKTGTYTGDDSEGQAITGVGFQPKYVKVWIHPAGEGAAPTTEKLDQSWADYALSHQAAGGHAIHDNRVSSLDADGFTVDDNGANEYPNTNGTVYDYLALQ